jgi:hypothetical protein
VVAVCVLALLWVAGCAGLYAVMRQPPETFGRFMAKLPGPVAFLIFPFETLWLRARSGTLRPGDPAPDFTLTRLDKSGQVRLSSFFAPGSDLANASPANGKPVVLIFGSYT